MTRIKTTTLGLAIVAAIFGGIALSMAFGYWKTESTKEPVKIKEGEFAGLPNPADIRGSYTWADVAKAFAIPEGKVLEAFGATDPGQKVNSLETTYAGALPEGQELGTDSVRLFAALYTGLPHEPEASTVLPMAAIAVLRAEGKADASRIDAAATRAFGGLPVAPVPAAAAPATPAETVTTQAPAKPAAAPATSPVTTATTVAIPGTAQERESVTGTIVGKTTFGDLAEWGLDMKRVEAILGGLGPAGQSIRDYCEVKGLEFSSVKTSLNELAQR